jgi:hypothetical protein
MNIHIKEYEDGFIIQIGDEEFGFEEGNGSPLKDAFEAANPDAQVTLEVCDD